MFSFFTFKNSNFVGRNSNADTSDSSYVENPATASFQPDSTCNTISIPEEEYRKLCQATIDLIKAERMIEKLNDVIAKKEIKEVKKSNLSPVS